MLRNLKLVGCWAFVFILASCQVATEDPSSGGSGEGNFITTPVDLSSARILITEVYAPSPTETVVEIFIQDGGARPENLDPSFRSPSIPLDRIGLRSPAKRPGESVSYNEAYHFNFDRFLDASLIRLYEGNFYVLVFTNNIDSSLPQEYVSATWTDNNGVSIPAITDDCLEMELTFLNDEGIQETQDYIRAGVSCSGSVADVTWDSTGGALSVPRGGESMARRIHDRSTETGFIQTLNVFQASEWEIAGTSTPAYPPDAGCVMNGGGVDADADGIMDCLEAGGETYFGMSLYDWGARPGQTDIFVELDYMACEVTGDLRSQPDWDVAMRMEAQFAEYMPAGGHPLSLHIDVGDLFGENLHSGFNLGGGNSVISDPSERTTYWGVNLSDEDGLGSVHLYYYIKGNHFSPARKQLFHYMLLAETTDPAGGPGDIAGIAELRGNDSLITLGGGSLFDAGLNRYPNCDINQPTIDDELARVAKNFYQNDQATTILHELGHNLGLGHGGAIDDDINFKPNYFSIMNYLYGSHGPPSSEDSAEVISKHVRDAYYHWTYREEGRDCFRPDSIDLTILGSNFTGTNFLGARVFGEPQELRLFFTELSDFHLDYSSGHNGDLRERGIDENHWFDIGVSGGSTTPMTLDFNCDGRLSTNIAQSDINLDGFASLSFHNDHDDIDAIRSFFANTSQVRIASSSREDYSEAREGREAEGSLFVHPSQKVFDDRQPVVSLQEERIFRGHARETFSKLPLLDGGSSQQ